MKRSKLMLRLKKEDQIVIRVQGHELMLGVIELDTKCPLNAVRLFFDFVPSIAVVRKGAKKQIT